MRKGWLLQGALAIAVAAATAWFVSQPSVEPWVGRIVVGLIVMLAAVCLLSISPIGPALRRFGIGAFRSMAERRLSSVTGVIFGISVYLMKLTLGPHPSFQGAFSWELVTFAVIGTIYLIARRRRQTAFA